MVFYCDLFTFALMKKKYFLISQFFGYLVLFAIVLQSVHSIHHLEKTFIEKQCHHSYSKSGTEITHAHHNLDHCFVCEFTFSTAVNAGFISFEYKNSAVSNSYAAFHSKEITNYFKGSLFALRAPPVFIV